MENDDSEPTKKKFRNHLVWIIVLVLGVIGIIVVLICWAVGLFTIPKVKPGNSGLHASYVDVCRQQKTGRFPYPDDCQKFVECGERIASVLQCPKGYYYKQDIKQCTEDTNSTCKGQASAQHAQIESVKGGWSEWGNWTTCSKTCGTGTQTRDRLCDNPTPQPLNNDTKCMGNEQQIRKCNENECLTLNPGGWSEWGNWTTCSKTCGTGTQTRDRLCNNPTPQPLNNDTKCMGNEQQTRKCNENKCPVFSSIFFSVKGGWSEWGNWTICSKTCGTGTQTRDRLCNNPTPQPLNNDTKCKGNEQQTRKCNENKCPAVKPVKGGWSEWGNWTTCSKTCGAGTQTRDRLCNNPTPQPLNNDTKCKGNEQQTRECNENMCPVKGGWSEWGNWTICSKTCDTGTQTRDRLCNNPTPQPLNNDTKCKGNEQQTRKCNENKCPAVKPVKGGWSQWGTWTICSNTCGTGTQTRDRLCNNPAPQPLTKKTKCKGTIRQTRKCYKIKCPVVKPEKNRFRRLGCYKSTANSRALDIDMEEFPKSMPAHKRIVNCASLAEVYQAVYFGVQSKTCYIDLEDGEHNFLKNGKSNKCKKGVGGLNAMTVYEVNPKN